MSRATSLGLPSGTARSPITSSCGRRIARQPPFALHATQTTCPRRLRGRAFADASFPTQCRCHNQGETMTNATNVETQHLKVGDVSYAYRELCPAKLVDPTPVVFLHRFRGTLDDWDPAFVDELAKTRHVILFSDAAVGSSTGIPAKDVDEKARNAASFARKLGYEQIDVLGFSMGGFVCQVIAIQEPKLVRKVIVIGSGPAGNAETAPPTDIVFGIALRETYAFEDIRYLFFAEGREQETRAYIERAAIRKDREPIVWPAGDR